MVKQLFHIKNYWTIAVCYDADLGEVNSGFTRTDFNKRLSIVCIGTADSRAQFLNTIVHEAKHVQSHICMYYGIDEDTEDAAYLIGYIIMKMYDGFAELLCSCQ
jgi:hypothetical protein